MTYARITDWTIDAILGNPPKGARRLDTGAWVTPPDGNWTPELLAACGWQEVVDAPEPERDCTGDYLGSVEAIEGVATKVWTFREYSPEEQENCLAMQESQRRAESEAMAEEELVKEQEAVISEQPAVQWTELGDRVGPGQQFIWSDGNTWRNSSGHWLPTSANPDNHPQSFSQVTGLPPEVAPFVVGEAVTTGMLREYEGVVYRVLQPHTTQAGWLPPNTPALWTPQG